jgi:prepilin-type N-terminal cleavage/methylation domain-containing protein
MNDYNGTRGFTLVEIAIVLVVIGFLVGGILVGRDLINAAALRAQISQVDKFTAAVNTFWLKYNCLPGDCADAANWGFAARGIYAGEGDGNGIIEGIYNDAPANNSGVYQGAGETGLFWQDLGKAGLISGSFPGPVANVVPVGNVSGSAIATYLPAAAIGGGNYVYVYSGGCDNSGNLYSNGLTYFGILAVTQINGGGGGLLESNPGLSVQQAYNIDIKIDDGLPQSGKVTVAFVYHSYIFWSNGTSGGGRYANPETNAEAASTTSCEDNGNVDGVTKHYSGQVNHGAGINCSLSFSVDLPM